MQQMNMMGGAGAQKMPGQQQDFNKMFTAERGFLIWWRISFNLISYFEENIELVKHKFVVENAEDVLLEKLRKIKHNLKK